MKLLFINNLTNPIEKRKITLAYIEKTRVYGKIAKTVYLTNWQRHCVESNQREGHKHTHNHDVGLVTYIHR